MSSKTIIKGLLITLKMKHPQESLLIDSLEQHFDENELNHEEEITVLKEQVTDMRAVNECLSSLLHDDCSSETVSNDEKDTENDGSSSKTGEIDKQINMKL